MVATRAVSAALVASAVLISLALAAHASPSNEQRLTRRDGKQWVVATYGECSAMCNGGIKSPATYECRDATGENVLDSSECELVNKPLENVACNQEKCAWQEVGDPTCTGVCGVGFKIMSFACFSPYNKMAAVDDSLCTGEKPDSVAACDLAACTWSPVSSGECSAPCGGGTQTVAGFECHDANGEVVEAENCVSVTKPDTKTMDCNEDQCLWMPTDDESACMGVCGKGSKTIAFVCTTPYNDTGVALPEELCKDEMPDTTVTCNLDVPCVWSPSAYGACDAPCGGGVQSATEYTCQTPAGEDIDEEYCDVDNQPEEAPTRPCNSEACMYKYGLYGSCSRSCGEGTKKRTATCIEPYGSKKVDDSFCDSLGKPVLSTKCTGTNCGTWSAGDDWSACTLECNGGQQTNKFECRDANKKVLTDSRCLGPKPADLKRNCNTGACAWVVDTSSACSKSCGPGTRTVTYRCNNPNTNAKATSEKSCLTAKPPTTLPCVNNPPCSYAWNVTGYGACSIECNGGTQKPTTFVCVQSTGGVVSSTLCAGKPKPTATKACNTAKCQWIVAKRGVCKVVPGGKKMQTVTYSCNNPNAKKPATKSTLCLSPKPPASVPCKSIIARDSEEAEMSPEA